MKNAFTKKIGVLWMFIFLLASTAIKAQYCESSSTNAGFEWLTNVTFAGIDQSSGPSGYSDYTSEVGTVSLGLSYEFSASLVQTFGGDNEYVQIWIDWNQDEVFDASERTQIGTVCTSNCTRTEMIDVPGDAVPGETRMRVILSYNVPSTDPCVSGDFGFDGETEDYSLYVQGGSCNPPGVDYEVVNNCVNDTYKVTAHIDSLGSSPFVTMHLTRSDGVPVNSVTIVPAIVGQTINLITNVPFGVTVHDSIVGSNPACTLIRNFAEQICPAENDVPCDATPLSCGDLLTDQTFLGATVSITDACFGSQTRDIWYSFVSDGSQHYIIGALNTDVVVSLYTGTDCGDITQVGTCLDFPESFDVTDAGTYYFKVRPYFANDDFVDISLNCVPFDCPDLLSDIGNACDDENPATYGDVITDTCTCAGHVPIPGEICEIPKVVTSLPYTDSGNTSTYLDDYEYTVETFPPLAPGAIVTGTIPYYYTTGDDVVYAYTPEQTESVNISVTNHVTYAGVFVFTGCPFASTLGYSTDYPANTPRNINGLVLYAGVTYYVVISTWYAPQSTSYNLSITSVPFDCPDLEANFGTACDDNNPNTAYDAVDANCDCVGIPIPANDEACGALSLACGDTLANQTFVGSSPSIADDCSNSTNGDIWFTFTADEGYSYVLNFVGGGSAFPYLTSQVLVGDDCGNLVPYIECVDYILGFYIDSAATYYVRARATTDATSMQISLNCYQEVDNGECDLAAEMVCGETYTGNTVAAPQHDPGQPFCVIGAPSIFNTGVWYTYTPTTDIDMTFDLSGSSFNTSLYLYSNTCESLVCVAADGDSGDNGQTSLLTSTLSAGTTYYLYITGAGNSRGEYILHTSCIDFECAPTIDSISAVTQAGDPIDCVNLNQPYYVAVAISGGSQSSYNASVNGGSAVSLAPGGTVILGPVNGGVTANVSIIGVEDASCSNSNAFSPNICAPENDTPCDAIELSVDGSVTGPYNNGYATVDPSEVAPPGIGGCIADWCEGSLTNTMWFTLTVPEGVERLSINACNVGTNFDTQLAAYTVGDCSDYSTFALIGANDDQSGGCTTASSNYASNLEICVEPGSTIYVQLDGYFGSVGNAYLSVEAIDSGVCSCVLPDVQLQSYPVCEGDGSPSFSVDVIITDLGSSDYLTFSYILNDESIVVDNVTEDFTVDNIPLGTFFEMYVSLSDPSCSDVGDLYASVYQDVNACDPDCEGVPGGPVGPGSPCDYGGEPGVYDGNCDCVGLATNDEACTATPIVCNQPVTQTSAGATQSMDPIACDGFTAAQAMDVWFSFVADGVSSYTIEETSFTDVVIEAFSSNGCGELTSIGCNDIGPAPNFNELIDLGVLEAGTYYIRDYPYSDFSPPYDLAIVLNCVNNSSATLNGSVTWNSACGERDAVVSLYEPGTSTLIAEYNTTIGSDGTFSIADPEVGTYDVLVNVEGYLAIGVEDVEIMTGDNSLAIGAIIRGDVNNDGFVNFVDFSIVNAAFGSVTGDGNYNALADLNCSGTVDFVDVSFLNAAFGQMGDSAPLGL